MRLLTGLVVWIVIAFIPAAIGGRYMPGRWYFEELVKPSFTPPPWLFGPVWTILYLLMGIAAWRVWRQGGFARAGVALTVFLIHLIPNGLWSYLFFGLHLTGWALVDIVVMVIMIIATMMVFARHDRVAAYLLAPYLAWVSFATILNWSIWRLNS